MSKDYTLERLNEPIEFVMEFLDETEFELDPYTLDMTCQNIEMARNWPDHQFEKQEYPTLSKIDPKDVLTKEIEAIWDNHFPNMNSNNKNAAIMFNNKNLQE